MKDDQDDLMFNQRTCARLLKISLQAFQRWDLQPAKRKGTQAFYRWSDVEAAAARKRSRNTRRDTEAALEPDSDQQFAGNVFRFVTWHQLGALAHWLPQTLAIAAKGENWEQRFGLTSAQAAAIVLHISALLPEALDVFLAEHHDSWFAGKFGLEMDAFATKLFGRAVGEGAREHGAFMEDFGAEPMAAEVLEFIPAGVPFLTKQRAAMEKGRGR